MPDNFTRQREWKGFKQLERRSLKKSRLQQDSNLWPLWYRCDALRTGGHGFESRWSPDFFRLLLSNCLNWKIHCDDHSSLLCTTAVLIWITSYILHIIKLVVRMITTPWMCVSEILWIQLSPSILLCIFTKKTTKQNKKHTKCSWSQSSVVMASWLAHLTLKWVVQVGALSGDTVLCSWAKHITRTVPGSTQVYKWVLVNLILSRVVGNPVID